MFVVARQEDNNSVFIILLYTLNSSMQKWTNTLRTQVSQKHKDWKMSLYNKVKK